MPAATLSKQSPGRYVLNGELGFSTVTDLLVQSRSLFASDADIQLDLSGVTHADSAGLSLLVEWLRQAKLQGHTLQYLSLPAQLQALAGISEVEGLFSRSA